MEGNGMEAAPSTLGDALWAERTDDEVFEVRGKTRAGQGLRSQSDRLCSSWEQGRGSNIRTAPPRPHCPRLENFGQCSHREAIPRGLE